VEIVASLSKALNFTPIYHGATSDNFTRVAEEVGVGDYDATAMDMSISDVRSQIVDFSVPIDSSAY